MQRREAGLHTAAQRLELRALTAAGRPAEIPPLVDQLVKRKVYDAKQGEFAERLWTPVVRKSGNRALGRFGVTDLPPLPDEGAHTLDEMWANITYFLKAVIPEAEKAKDKQRDAEQAGSESTEKESGQ